MATIPTDDKVRNKGGRPFKEKPEELEGRVAAYFDKCYAESRFPTESGMILYLRLAGKKAQDYLADPAYAEVWERARYRRMDWLENQMVTEPKCANGCMNALKQEKNGGYADRSAPEKKTKGLVIKMLGVGKGAAD